MEELKKALREVIENATAFQIHQSIGNGAKLNCAIEEAEKVLALADVVVSEAELPSELRKFGIFLLYGWANDFVDENDVEDALKEFMQQNRPEVKNPME